MNTNDNDLSVTEITNQISSMDINTKPKIIGYLFDERMLLHRDSSLKHQECPERVMAVYMNLFFKNLTEKLTRIPIEEASKEDILRVHTEEYYNLIYNLQFDINGNPRKKTDTKKTLKEKDSYDNVYTFDAAIVSAGSLISVCKSVMSKKVDHAFAIIRPPGHHANIENCHGFCYFNNVAIATEYLINKHKAKVAILDWDVHHGDGTQQIFYKKKNPLFISIHRHDEGNFYPFATGKLNEQGEDEGKGFNINLPWNTKVAMTNGDSAIGDAEYMLAFDTLVIPILKQYDAEIILISCGFDAGEYDFSGMLKCTPMTFAYMTHLLMSLGKKLVFALEGGYCIDTIKRCSEAVIRTLLGDNLGFKDLMINHYSKLNSIINDKCLNVERIVSSYKQLFIPCSYALQQIKLGLLAHKESWSCLNTSIDTLTNSNYIKHRIIRRDTVDTTTYPQLKKLLIEQNEEDMDKSFMAKNDDFIIFKVGKEVLYSTITDWNNPDNKFLKKQIKAFKTVLPDLGFNIEGIKCSKLRSNATKLEKLLNWSKDECKYDMNPTIISTIISKFFQTMKIKKEGLIEAIEKFILKFNEMNTMMKVDLYDCDVIFILSIPVLKEQVKEDTVKEEESKGIPKNKKGRPAKFALPKVNIDIKLNGIKKGNVIPMNENSINNFIEGLKGLKTFICDNVLI